MRASGVLTSVGLLAGCLVAHAAPAVVTIDDRNVYPESLDSTPDGTLYIGGSNGRIYRARSGQAYAEPWILPENSGLHPGVRGVVADGKNNMLWVCDNNGRESAVFRFALDSGRKRDSFSFPGGGHCNDIALRNGAAYLTDTTKGRILKLAAGASQLEVWYTNDASDLALDGIAWTRSGELFINTVNAGHLIRVDVKPDGSAGKGAVLKTTLDISQPDGLRLSPDGKLLMVEGRAKPGPGLKDGRLDEVIVHGDTATIKVLATGFEYPTAVTVTGNAAWILESKFDYQRNPALKGQDPGNFHVYRVPSRPED
jgi:DNA-binding beta-propeller fold protein YncE